MVASGTPSAAAEAVGLGGRSIRHTGCSAVRRTVAALALRSSPRLSSGGVDNRRAASAVGPGRGWDNSRLGEGASGMWHSGTGGERPEVDFVREGERGHGNSCVPWDRGPWLLWLFVKRKVPLRARYRLCLGEIVVTTGVGVGAGVCV